MKTGAGSMGMLVLALAMGAGLMFVPAEAARPFRTLFHDILSPGQTLLDAAWRQSRAWSASWPATTDRQRGARDLDAALRSARLENRRLEVQLADLRSRFERLSAQQGLAPLAASPPLLITPKLIEARVIGDETAALWRGRKLLSAGTREAIAESALVLDDARPLVDVGDDGPVASGDAVYAGRIVIGKIAEAGRYTSTLRLVTDPAYSGRARLARRTSQGLVFGPEGTFVGDGSDLCRLKHIADPVNVGDEVFTGGTDGVLPFPMYYGQVVRAELDAGSREWSIWVKPAASGERLETVVILRRAVNPQRMLAN